MMPIKQQPMELSEFKGLGPHMPTTEIDIPEKPENRITTDKAFLIVFLACLIMLIPLVIYAMVLESPKEVVQETSMKNNNDEDCTDQDFNDQSMTETKLCIPTIPTDIVLDAELATISYNIEEKIEPKTGAASILFRLLLCSLITVGVSIAVLHLYRLATFYVVWGILTAVPILGFIIAVYEWSNGDAAFGIFIAICLLIYIGTIFIVRQKIPLVIILLREATHAAFAIPSLMYVCLWKFLTDITLVMIFGATTLNIGDDQIAILYYNGIMAFWCLYFLRGMQYMVIGGAVSEWYFAEDKFALRQTVRRSATITMKYHLGTVAFGSSVILLAAIVRMIIRTITKNRFLAICCSVMIACLEDILKLITNKAYIITAMHGQPFLKSGKRADQIMRYHLGSIITICFVTTAVLVSTAIFIALISWFLGQLVLLDLNDTLGDLFIKLILIFVVLFLDFYIAASFLEIFATTVDTIFLCFCEDSLLNDGMARPYAMSKELMEFVENAKKLYGEKTDNFQTISAEFQFPEAV